MLEFSVTDTGLGIAPGEQDRIFEAFEQADGSVTRKFGGTGLGLAISRQLVDLMHGSMGLESEPGRGSRFSFRIPLGVPRIELPTVAPTADLGVLVIGLHPVVRSAVCDTISVDARARHQRRLAASARSKRSRISRPAVSRIRVILDSNATATPRAGRERSARGSRAAPGRNHRAAAARCGRDAARRRATRCLVKPLCTVDLLDAASAPDTSQSLRMRVLPVTGSRGRALVVEDNAVNQEMARAMLDMLGFTVSTASNGREGVAAAAARPRSRPHPHGLPDARDGRSRGRARDSRQRRASGSRVPIVALTGNAMPGDREACVAAGMDDYLAKPFSLTALKAMLDKWTGEPAS